MRVTAIPDRPTADTRAVGVTGPVDGVEEARAAFGHLAVWREDGRRVIGVGLGEGPPSPERARVLAAKVAGRARELGTRTLEWDAPDGLAGPIAEGTLLAAYRHDRFKSAPAAEGGIEELQMNGDVARAVVVAGAANRCRDLQNAPANVMTPSALAEHAQSLEGVGVQVEVEGTEGLERRGMGAFAAVARGSYEPPALIRLRHEPPDAVGPRLGFVGKAVTFDSGGISIKPSGSMADMKFDMSGGAAVIEAIGAIARLGLPVRVTGVVGATENMPSGRSMRPSDVLTAMNGTTIEVVNTDCEGRLVLADCLTHAIELGAERIVELSTLTGATASFLGSTYAALFAADGAWAEQVLAAGERTGEIAWRLPLHEEYDELIKGSTGDIVNLNEPRKAGAITAAQFLQRFAGEVPFAHLDIAGVAEGLGRAYAPKGASGWGVRLLVDLAAQVAQDSGSDQTSLRQGGATA